jgi:hypothetical protein
MEQNHPDDYAKIRKLQQSATFIHADVVAVVVGWCQRREVELLSAPFEADWQLAMLQKQDIIQGVITDDSDLFVLGCDNILMDINIMDHTCYLVERAAVKDHLTRLLKMATPISDDQIHEYAAFLGSDYITNIAGFGEKTVDTFMITWVGLSDEQKNSKLLSLSDRGFAGGAILYPNINGHLTPAFVGGRPQFEVEEVHSDKDLKKLRYTSEVFFARVTNTTILPYSALQFSALQSISPFGGRVGLGKWGC